jgi:hypothetical protein
MKQAAWGIAFVVAVLAFALYSSGQDEGPDNEREAVAQCEGFADKRLKAPASADYDLTATESGGSWTVTGTVDAENSFGAQIRNDVTCKLHFEGDTAYLDDIKID